MSYFKRHNAPKIYNQSIVLPIVTLAVIGLIFYFLNYYKPTWSYDWSGIRTEVWDTVKQIERYGSITSGVVGVRGITPAQWYRRIWLTENASKEELTALLTYPNGIVKAAAYESLIRKEDLGSYSILNQALNDTTAFFYYTTGCTGWPMMIGEYLVENVVPISDEVPPPRPEKTVKHKLTDDELDSLIEKYKNLIQKKEEYRISSSYN